MPAADVRMFSEVSFNSVRVTVVCVGDVWAPDTFGGWIHSMP